jgi:hypothetical protein
MVQVGHVTLPIAGNEAITSSACGPYVVPRYSARKHRALVAATRLCLDQPCREFDRMNNEEPDHLAGVISSRRSYWSTRRNMCGSCLNRRGLLVNSAAMVT